MKLIDTHTHLYLKEFENDIDQVIQRANAAGVEKFYLPAIDSSETEAQIALEKKYPDQVFAMAGLHPCSVKENFQDELELIDEHLSKRKFAGIGETGLDFYWDTSFEKQQYESLHIHAQWAVQYKRPLILHTRNATRETIDALSEYKSKGLYGVFHCFGGNLQEAKEIMDSGFFLGIGGVLTFKNSGLADIIKNIALEKLVLETDAPYLAPVPFRGKRNESSYLKYIVEKLAEIKSVSVEEAAEQTSKNAESLFSEK